MRRHDWADRLGTWLPSPVAHELYAPALADLRVERLQRRRHAGRLGYVLHQLLFVLAVLATWAECLRLSAGERVAVRPAARPRSVGHTGHPRREYVVLFLQDLRRALRVLRLEPGFSAAAVLTLALGVGVNTALFAVVEAVLLRPLPYPEAGELVVLRHRDRASGVSKEFIAIGDFLDVRQRQQTLASLAGYGTVQTVLFGQGEPVRLTGVSATPELFELLRLQPAMGRPFTAADVREGAQPVAWISHELWQTQFGSDPDILSRSILTGSTRRLVVGVAPPGFHFPPAAPTQIVLPHPLPPAAPAERKAGWIFALGRLRSGHSAATAGAEMQAIAAQLEQEHPAQNRGSEYYMQPLREALVGDSRRPLLLLLGAVGFVLLIACANVGNLMLARSLARQPEFAVRVALGARASRLAAQVLAEGLVLAIIGGAVGLLIAWRAAPALAALVPESTRVPGLDRVSLDPRVLAFALAASLAAALFFSAVSFLSLRRGTGMPTTTRRATTGVAGRRAASALVVAEVALAAVLLVGAGLTLRSFANLLAVDPGFRTRNVLAVNVALPSARYQAEDARRAFFARAFPALEALPGVERAGAAAVTPLTGNNWTVGVRRADQPLAPGERAPEVGWQSASAGYFAALQIPLREGRLFDARDAGPGPGGVIVSEALARRLFPGESPVGRQVTTGNGPLEIVGVVGDIRRASLADAPRADMYFPFEHAPSAATTLFLRTSGDAAAALAPVRVALRALEPDVLVVAARTMEDVAAESAAVTRLVMRLLAGFAVLALVLAAIGIYGVMAYSVRRRTRELGTRLALGARRQDIVRLVLKEGAAVTLAGLALGLAGGLGAARSLGSVLYGVSPGDPLSVGISALVLAGAALLACGLPALRASRVDPARTLASE